MVIIELPEPKVAGVADIPSEGFSHVIMVKDPGLSVPLTHGARPWRGRRVVPAELCPYSSQLPGALLTSVLTACLSSGEQGEIF